MNTFELTGSVEERPAQAWPDVNTLLAGATERYVQGERWTHRVIERGAGEPLLLYHGVGGHAETYARTLEALSKHFHVFAVDALFHGGSSKEGFDLAGMYDLLTEGVIDLIDALGFDSVHFEGESMGAMIGASLALEHPDRIRRMVLSAGFYLLQTVRTDFAKSTASTSDLGARSRAAVLDPTFENVQRRMQWLVHDPNSMTDDIVAVRQRLYSDPEVNASMRRVFNLEGERFGTYLYHWPYTEDDLRGWKPETLVLWGEHNPGWGPDFGAYCADLIGGDFYVVRDAGHWPQWEKPDEYAQVLIEFLTRPST